MNEGLLTPKQARERFGVSKSTLYRWRLAGLLTEYRLPSGKNAPFRYDPKELERLLKPEG